MLALKQPALYELCSDPCKVNHNCARTFKHGVLQSATTLSLFSKELITMTRVTTSRVSSKLCAAVAGGASGFLLCLAPRRSCGGGDAVCGAELISKCGSEILLGDLEGESKGRLVEQQNLVRVADNSVGFGFEQCVRIKLPE